MTDVFIAHNPPFRVSVNSTPDMLLGVNLCDWINSFVNVCIFWSNLIIDSGK